MRMIDIIQKKRDGLALTKAETTWLIEQYAIGQIPDYQISAWAMAVCFQGMNKSEIADLTMAMVATGEQIDLSDIPGVKVDKHSTGGVGDKVTLILAPLVASFGVSVAKMSGRGLGHTGGTIDKLESIHGFQVERTQADFVQQVRDIGISVIGQSDYLVKADKLQMQMIADELSQKLKIPVEVGGVEADMAIRGALTTPGSSKPLAILDMGAGSTDASIITREGHIKSIHLAGAGNMVTMLIKSELGIDDFELAEDIKKYPLAKVESLFNLRHEDGTVEFFNNPLDSKVFAKIVILKEGNMIPLEGDYSLEKVKLIRKNAKEKVFVTNALRALADVSPTGNIRDMEFVVLVGGSALDFEIPQLVTDALAQYKIVAGRANIRGCEGPRNAVATGLILSSIEEGEAIG